MPVSPGAHDADAPAILLPAGTMADTVEAFIQRYGFRVVRVFPADDPQTIELVGWGLRLVLDTRVAQGAAALRLPLAAAPAAGVVAEIAPNGVRIEWGAPAMPDVWQPILPEARRIAASEDAGWHVGRAGLRYRDLLPDRLGGGIVASQIRLLEGGPVADYVHYHRVSFQMIYCRSGWVEVVYEDQGPPFVMSEGDCVLQPPGIRHRVLASSAGAEVVELACPASHETLGDLNMTLPSPEVRSGLRYGGQDFVWYRAQADAGRLQQGWNWRDFGFVAATDDMAEAGVYQAQPGAAALNLSPDGVFHFVFVLSGEVETGQAGFGSLRRGEGAVFQPGLVPALAASPQSGCTLLYVRLLRQPNVRQPLIEERPR